MGLVSSCINKKISGLPSLKKKKNFKILQKKYMLKNFQEIQIEEDTGKVVSCLLDSPLPSKNYSFQTMLCRVLWPLETEDSLFPIQAKWAGPQRSLCPHPHLKQSSSPFMHLTCSISQLLKQRLHY